MKSIMFKAIITSSILILTGCASGANVNQSKNKDNEMKEIYINKTLQTYETKGLRGNKCNAKEVQNLIGQKLLDNTLEKAVKKASADVGRVLPKDTAITREYMMGRLNITVDDDKKIIRVSCG